MKTDSGPHPFDLLQFDVLWKAQGVYFEIFQRRTRLSVRADRSGPKPGQRAAFDAFHARQLDLKPAVDDAILAYYRSIVDEYREQFTPDFLHLAPLIASVTELHRVITPQAVYVPDTDPENREIGLLFDCTWDDSHGLGVRLIRGEVAKVGPQDICL